MTRVQSIVTTLMLVLWTASAWAQARDAVACETEANRRKTAWASASHPWFATALELELRELQLSSCRMRASTGEEKFHQAENVGRVFFTGEGLHPVVGTIAPGNGFAGGGLFHHEWATMTTPLR